MQWVSSCPGLSLFGTLWVRSNMASSHPRAWEWLVARLSHQHWSTKPFMWHSVACLSTLAVSMGRRYLLVGVGAAQWQAGMQAGENNGCRKICTSWLSWISLNVQQWERWQQERTGCLFGNTIRATSLLLVPRRARLKAQKHGKLCSSGSSDCNRQGTCSSCSLFCFAERLLQSSVPHRQQEGILLV